MRIDDVPARTWLLAGIAGWMVATWLLALAGMGARVEPLDEDPALAAALPAPAAAATPALGPREQYRTIEERPLFAPDRQPQPFFLEGSGETGGDQAFDYLLTSVIRTPGLQMAILQPAAGGEPVRVRLDEAPAQHPGWRLVALDPRSAAFEGPEGRRELTLRVFDGVGGVPPTAVAAPDAPAAAATSPAPVQATTRPPSAPAAPPARPEEGADAAAVAANPDAATPVADAPASDAASAGSEPLTEQAQMDAIRQRIEARRARMREQDQRQPPGNNR